MKSPITTHVLDTAIGRPAAGVPVVLESENAGQWTIISRASTDLDGRVSQLVPTNYTLRPGAYRLTFELTGYFAQQARRTFYPHATIVFLVDDTQQHYHVPLLLSGFGFSTYRGS